MFRRSLVSSCSVIGLSVLLNANAFAQEQDQSSESLEEIIITATKRAQTLQEVPIAVSAYNAELLKNAGVADLRELTQLSPSLFLSSSASEAAGAVARIRGVGTTGDNPGLESSVAVFIDGVYRNRTNVGLTELGELERVEVLRGPQGTLFGRNASAGLISVTTKSPTYEFSGYGEVGYGNHDQFRVAAGLSGPLVADKVAARIDGVFHKRDGFIDDKVTGIDYNDRDRYLLRGQLLIDPNEDISIRLIADYSDRDENCCAAVTLIRGATAGFIEALGGQLGSGGSDSDPDPFSRRSATSPNRGFQQDVEEYGFSGEVNWDIGDVQLTSITAWRNWENFRSQDIDFTSADILYREENGFRQEFETLSQEIRLNGQVGIVDWLFGFYYADEDLALDDRILLGDDYEGYANFLVCAGLGVLPPACPSLTTFPGYDAVLSSVVGAPVEALAGGTGVAQDRFRQNSRNFAIFTHNIISITDLVDLTLGARYTDERKRLDALVSTNNSTCSTLAAAAGVGAIPASLLTLPCLPFFNPFVDGTFDSVRKEDEFTGTVALNVRWNEDISTYASYSRGYKAGGFNLDRAALTVGAPNADADLQFREETVNSYELGAKYRSPNRTVNINAAAFFSKFDDFQLNTFNGISFVVENLPKVESYGFELEGAWQATENLTFNGGVTYANTQYGNNLGSDPIFTQPDATTPAGALFQLAGQQITNAPKWSLVGSSTYNHPLGDSLKALLHLDFRYTSSINTGSDLDLEKVQDGVFVMNGRLGLGHIDDNWQIEVWTRNMFDKDYVQIAFDAPLQGSGTARNTFVANTQTFNAFLAEPRTFGFTLRGRF